MNAELTRLLREGRWVQPTSAAGVLGVGAAAFLLSYDALHSLALASGVRPGLARIWPGVLDGFIVVATLTVVAAKRASRPTWYPWALVVLFSAASVAFNILHAGEATPEGRTTPRVGAMTQPAVATSRQPESPAAAGAAGRPPAPAVRPPAPSPDAATGIVPAGSMSRPKRPVASSPALTWAEP